MRLIDADALTKKLQHLWNIHDDVDFNNKDVWNELENAPTIDAVEVVRCKDCIHNQYGFCEKVNHNTGYVRTCADVLRAEKRENDGRFKNDT